MKADLIIGSLTWQNLAYDATSTSWHVYLVAISVSIYFMTQLSLLGSTCLTTPFQQIVTKVYFSFAVHFRGMSLKGCSDVFSSFLWFSFLAFQRFISVWRNISADMTKAQFCKVILWTNQRANRQEAKSWKKPTEDHNQH